MVCSSFQSAQLPRSATRTGHRAVLPTALVEALHWTCTITGPFLTGGVAASEAVTVPDDYAASWRSFAVPSLPSRELLLAQTPGRPCSTPAPTTTSRRGGSNSNPPPPPLNPCTFSRGRLTLPRAQPLTNS